MLLDRIPLDGMEVKVKREDERIILEIQDSEMVSEPISIKLSKSDWKLLKCAVEIPEDLRSDVNLSNLLEKIESVSDIYYGVISLIRGLKRISDDEREEIIGEIVRILAMESKSKAMGLVKYALEVVEDKPERKRVAQISHAEEILSKIKAILNEANTTTDLEKKLGVK